MNATSRTIAAGIITAAGFTAFTACGDAQDTTGDISVVAPGPTQAGPATSADAAERQGQSAPRADYTARPMPDYRP
jgi:hypothetical protein